MDRWIGITGGALGAASVVVLLLHEIARLQGQTIRARRLAMFAPGLLFGFFGVVVIRFADLL